MKILYLILLAVLILPGMVNLFSGLVFHRYLGINFSKKPGYEKHPVNTKRGYRISYYSTRIYWSRMNYAWTPIMRIYRRRIKVHVTRKSKNNRT